MNNISIIVPRKPEPAWTIAENPAQSTQFARMYTLYYSGLVRGHLCEHAAHAICAALNAAELDGIYGHAPR